LPWKACFEEAWAAYCNGSIPIGAVLVDEEDHIVSRGRNRVHEAAAPDNQTCSNRLAHAEINALLQIKTTSSDELKRYTLYSTTEPCVLCFGAIVMSGVRKVRYAASDPIAGGIDLNKSSNRFILSRMIEVGRGPKLLGNVQRVLRTDQVIRALGLAGADRFLQHYIVEHPEAVTLGKRWHEAGLLQEAGNTRTPVEQVFNEIAKELGHA
jgi:tRNA(Arg) A34 adenosine deaminase TadA